MLGLVTFGGVNVVLLLYLAWSDQRSKRETEKMEKQLSDIKLSVSGQSESLK